MEFLTLVKLFDSFLEVNVEDVESDKRTGMEEWRLSRVYDGKLYADYIGENFFSLNDKVVVDIGCAWGGHLLAFCSLGAKCVGFDINNHKFSQLNLFCQSNNLKCRFQMATYESLPIKSGACDVVLAFELLEHIRYPQNLASEISRILRRGGIAVIATPARIKTFFDGEPHFGLKYITLFPISLQKLIAFKILKRKYPYPVYIQYILAANVLRLFENRGLIGFPVCNGRIARMIKGIPGINGIYRALLWDYIIVKKP